MTIRPVGPEVPPALRALLTEIRDAVVELQTPTYPHPLFSTTTALQPPAARFTGRVYWNTTISRLAVSNGVNWLRTDTGAAI